MQSEHKKIVLATNESIVRDTALLALAGEYSLYAFPNAEKLMQYAERTLPDLILFSGGLEKLETLRSGDATRRVPVIFLTKPGDYDSECAALDLGAADCVQNTATPQLLRRRVDLQVGTSNWGEIPTTVYSFPAMQAGRLQMDGACASAVEQPPYIGGLGAHEASMRQEAMKSPIQGATATINARDLALNMVVELVECRDGSTRGHIDRTERFMRALTDGMASYRVYMDELRELGPESLCLASKLHDLGKVGIRDSILRKPGVLTVEEFEEMKTHTTIGEEVIDRLRQHVDETAFFSLARVLAGSHHERWDGAGYPRGLSGEGIPLAGRLMAIVDVYDALTSERPYKPAYPHDLAARLIIEEGGRHFDPELISVFEASAPRLASILYDASESSGVGSGETGSSRANASAGAGAVLGSGYGIDGCELVTCRSA